MIYYTQMATENKNTHTVATEYQAKAKGKGFHAA